MCTRVASACRLTGAPVDLADQALAECLSLLCFPRPWNHFGGNSLHYKQLPGSVPSQPAGGVLFRLANTRAVVVGPEAGLRRGAEHSGRLSCQECLGSFQISQGCVKLRVGRKKGDGHAGEHQLQAC